MAVVTPGISQHNKERLDFLNKYRGRGLPFQDAQTGGVYNQALNYADQYGESPLKVADIERLGEAAYLRQANLPQYDQNAFRLNTLDSNILGQINANPYGMPEDVRNNQATLAQALMRRASGTGGPSLAELQLNQGLEAQQKGLLSGLASQRGRPTLGLALSRAYSNAASGVNQNAALLRAQEQMDAERSLAQALQAQRAGDISAASEMNRVGLANAANNLAAMNQNASLGSQLALQRGKDLNMLYAMNPESMVQTRNKKKGIIDTFKSNLAFGAGVAAPIAEVGAKYATLGMGNPSGFLQSGGMGGQSLAAASAPNGGQLQFGQGNSPYRFTYPE